MYRTPQPTTVENIFSGAYETFPRKDDIFGHKTSLNLKRKKIKIMQSIFFNHNEMKLESTTEGKSAI